MMQIKLERKKNLSEGEDSNIQIMRVFDFDDTIAETHSMVYVKNTDTGQERAITPAAFAVYEKQPNEEFDFREFAEVVKPKALPKTIKVFKKTVLKGLDIRDVTILTARASNAEENIRGYLKIVIGDLTGVDTSFIDSMTIKGLGSSKPTAKSDWILERSKKFPNLKKIEFIDDSPKNRSAVEALKQEQEIKEKNIQVIVTDPLDLKEKKMKKCEGSGCGKRKRVLLNVKIGA